MRLRQRLLIKKFDVLRHHIFIANLENVLQEERHKELACVLVLKVVL